MDFPDWDLAQGIADTTNADGEAQWRATCTSTGKHTVKIDVAGTTHTLHLPECVAAKKSDKTTTTTGGNG